MSKITNQELFHLLNQRVRYLTTELNAKLNNHGLYHSQWSILYCLDQFGPMTQTAIWKYLHVEAPTVTRTLSRMEKSGWVRRITGTDKRERVIEMTEEAKRTYAELRLIMDEMEQKMVEDFSLEEKQQLYQLLQKFGKKGDTNA